jgi:hypothetical protein
MKNFIPDFDLNDPEACRNFLKTARFGPKGGTTIRYIRQPDYTELPVDKCSEELVMEKAAQVVRAFFRK